LSLSLCGLAFFYKKFEMDTFGEWLHQQRNHRRLTRGEFANRVGCSVAMLQKIEIGERRPSAQIARLIANCLDIPAAEHETFVKVARGELGTNRITHLSNLTQTPYIFPTQRETIPRNNLPVLPTPLIGRERELEQLNQLLRDPQCRLLTLVGPGGIGKTRLAIEAASQIQNEFSDGVYFIPLASVNSPRFIVPMIADATGFSFQGKGSIEPKSQLFNYLKGKQILLLVDNLEHLISDATVTDLFVELLKNTAQVKLFVTSRELLNLQSEWVFEVDGLPIPEGAETTGTSVELFLQRARRAYVGFNLTTSDFPAIVRICQLMDGMPLGIELAAGWVRTLSCEEIAREIESSLEFLHTSVRDLPIRHRSMRAVFDHSWKLLDEAEQSILCRLSVFRGGFKREAAAVVAGATLNSLSSLATKSLIRRRGDGRYDLHEVIRQFTAEQLAERPDEQAATQARHARYYLTYFSSTDKRLHSSEQGEALTELTAETDNFRAVWDWAVSHAEFFLIEQTARVLAMFYDTRGWLQEGLDILGSAVDALEAANRGSSPDRTNQVALGHILAFRSVLASRLGQHEQAQAMLERSLQILRPLNEPPALVEAITYLGIDMELTISYAKTLELYSEGVETATSFGDRWGSGLCLTCVLDQIGIAQEMTDPEDTYQRLQAAVAEWRALGYARFTAFGLNLLSWHALALGHADEARAALEESISLSESIGDRWGLAFAYRGLGLIAQAQGKHAQAVEMFGKSLDILTEVGMRQDEARVLVERSRSIFALGNEAEAERGWYRALRITTETKSTFIALEALVGIARLSAKQGKIERALELLLIVLNHPASLQETKTRADSLRTELEAQLTPRQVEAVQARTGEKKFEAVVEDLLELVPPLGVQTKVQR